LFFQKQVKSGQGLLQRLCRPKTIKGEQGEKVCCFEVVLFTLFFGFLNVFIYHVIYYGSERRSCSEFPSVVSRNLQEF
jgi:hypothetical protein